MSASTFRSSTVFTGVSGSGKSSLVFDTIAAESQRQLDDTFSTFVRHRLPHHPQPDADSLQNVIEHQMDVIAQADWVIDMGQEAGQRGGRVVFAGTVAAMLANGTGETAIHLRRHMA
jgi:excinuclease UvrABC ATPase subunit